MNKVADRDRLIELLKPHVSGTACLCESGSCELTSCRDCKAKRLADYLLANGVIVPPCKVGDTVYYVHETLWDKDYKNKVLSESVKKRILKIVERKNHATNLALEVLHFDYCFITDWIKGNIFLTKEEAEQALKEREK